MSGTKAIDTALTALKRILMLGDKLHLPSLAEELGISQATLYRHIDALTRQGLLQREGKSAFTPGIFLLKYFDRQAFFLQLQAAARPVIAKLTAATQLTVHLGVYDQDMVTYLVKSSAAGLDVFTREATQLDAYCSGLGKVLLASLPAAQLDAYFCADQLPALTSNTLTCERDIRREIHTVRKQGYAVDNEEFEERLFCVAVPVYDRDKLILAALSASSNQPAHIDRYLTANIDTLRQAADKITQGIYTIKRGHHDARKV